MGRLLTSSVVVDREGVLLLLLFGSDLGTKLGVNLSDTVHYAFCKDFN